MRLKEYQAKRDFTQTAEPRGLRFSKKGKNIHEFVIHKHWARRLHYDLRLENKGVLVSWAVPKGPSLDPKIKHLAIKVEDHPYEYRKFEGTIPKGHYGAGEVIIWDKGTYQLQENKFFEQAIKQGSLKFFLNGDRIQGNFKLIKTGKEKDSWLLIKGKDEFSQTEKKKSDDKMPHRIKPMLATLFDKPFSKPGWIFEFKWDGYRAIAELREGNVVLYSRNLLSYNKRYPEIVADLAKIKFDAILDGEIVALDQNQMPNFQLLQNFSSERKGEIVYYIFDLLYFRGQNLMTLPLLERKRLLHANLPELKTIRYSNHVEKDGEKLFDVLKKQNFEGMIAKDENSEYLPGVRTKNWLKIKTALHQEFVICGYTENRSKKDQIGALILAIYENGDFRYVGHTGTGFTQKSQELILKKLRPLKTKTPPLSPIPKTNAPAVWVKPKLLAEVKFASWTKDRILRQAVFLGIREDKAPQEITLEKPITANPSPKPGFKNLDKIFWPSEKYTKGDVIDYYDKISDFIMPYLIDRPESLNRHPNGIAHESFFQKDINFPVPKFVKTTPIYSESNQKQLNYMLCQNKETLLFMANLGCIEINPWLSRIPHLDFPDFMVFDLDPGQISFGEVVKVAQVLKKILDDLSMESFCKTSGKTGLHIYVPLPPRYSYEQTKNFAKAVSILAHRALPKTTSVERSPKKRKRKIYLDFLQNRHGQTLSAPYSLRPYKGATVSMPLRWSEVNSRLNPAKFTIKTVPKQLAKSGDIWNAIFKTKNDLNKAFNKLEKLLS